MELMGRVDLLRPGQRLPERDSGDLAPLVRSFNEMLERLETERAVSSRDALLAQEAERKRVARELHDEVGQGLTVLLLQLSRSADRVPEQYRPMLQQGLTIAGESLADVRRIAKRLRPDVLENLGLEAALTELANEFTTYSGVSVRRRFRVARVVPEPVDLAIYRVAQESLTNIARHANASTAELELEVSDEIVRLVIADDGHGIMREVGAGIRGMRERALLVQGTLDINSTGSGTRVTLGIPCSSLEGRNLADATHTDSPR
jgi:two-component system sensor histidine kinase UhpB